MNNTEMTDTDRIICAVFVLLFLTHRLWLPLLVGA
jgi:hypothetical protein